MSVNSISGDVDITLPAKAPVSMNLSTMQGGFFSDFDISETDKDLKRIGGSHLGFNLNGGGVKFSVVTVTGNVYLRKGN